MSITDHFPKMKLEKAEQSKEELLADKETVAEFLARGGTITQLEITDRTNREGGKLTREKLRERYRESEYRKAVEAGRVTDDGK